MTAEQADAAIAAAAAATFNHAPACTCTPAHWGADHEDAAAMQAYTDHVAYKRYGPARAALLGLEPSECGGPARGA